MSGKLCDKCSTGAEKVAELKAEGNALFKAKKFKEAVSAYESAIAAADPVGHSYKNDEQVAMLHCNIATAKLKLGDQPWTDQALEHTETATNLCPQYAKVHSSQLCTR